MKKLPVIIITVLSVVFLVMGFSITGCRADAAGSTQEVVQTAEASSSGEFSDITLYFFVGGDEGDSFGTIVYNGARAAERDLGVNVNYVFSGWDSGRMVSQLRETIAANPDGISMQGHPGDEGLMTLVKEAKEKGIAITIANVPTPEIIETYNTGYTGAVLYDFGYRLGSGAVERFGLGPGDAAIVTGWWTQPAIAIRDDACADALEEAGVEVIKLDLQTGMQADPSLLTPQLTAVIQSNPGVKLVHYSGGQVFGASPDYMQALGKGPGEIKSIGFDLSPQIISGFDSGYINLAIDQQPFMQGYYPILNLAMNIKYGFEMPFIDTGIGLVDESNYAAFKEFVDLQVR
jgi:simple sugar transport system substrate-binding protein